MRVSTVCVALWTTAVKLLQ